MTDKNMPLSVLIDHFDEVGWPLHVNKQKFNDRASVASIDDSGCSVIVEIERHRPILGMTYIKGLGMEAFETYFMRYAVNVCNRSVSELTERHGKYNYDVFGIVDSQLSFDYFSLDIEPVDNNCYLIRESFFKEEEVVSSQDEAVAFVMSLGESIEGNFAETVDREFSEIENRVAVLDDLLSTYRKALNDALLKKAEQLWEERDD